MASFTYLRDAIAAYNQGHFGEAARLFIQAQYPHAQWGRLRLDSIVPTKEHYCGRMHTWDIDVWTNQGRTVQFLSPRQSSFPLLGKVFHIQTGHCGAHQWHSFRIEQRPEEPDMRVKTKVLQPSRHLTHLSKITIEIFLL